MIDIITHEVEACLKVLKGGGVILYPTDTVWGIGCDATNASAIDRIYKLKQRSEHKKMVVLLDSKEKLHRYLSNVPEKALGLIDSAEKPTTIIYDDCRNLAKNLVSDDQSIAIRIVKDEFCKQLIREFDKPIVSSSANLSNAPTPGNFSEISAVVLQGVDYVVNLHHDSKLKALPSSIIKLDSNGQITVIR